MSWDTHNLTNTKWWKINCMRLDIYDYLGGDTDLKKFKENMLYDLAWLKKRVEYEGTEKENFENISGELEAEIHISKETDNAK